MKKVILNCKVQSYFGIELLKTTLNELINESNSKISIVEIDCDEDEINGFQLSIQYETLEELLKNVAEISRTFEAEQIDAHYDSYGFWIESVIEE